MAEVTTNHETIRNWAEKKGGKPAAVAHTHQGADAAWAACGIAATSSAWEVR